MNRIVSNLSFRAGGTRAHETNTRGGSVKSSDLTRLNLTQGQLRALEGLTRGRQRAIELAKERAAKNAVEVMKEAIKDLDAGNPTRGRAKRIALGLPPGKCLTERSVKRILDRLSVCPIS